MRFEKVYVPYGGYWSTPFAKWQGSLAHLHAVKFAADVAKQALARAESVRVDIDCRGARHPRSCRSTRSTAGRGWQRCSVPRTSRVPWSRRRAPRAPRVLIDRRAGDRARRRAHASSPSPPIGAATALTSTTRIRTGPGGTGDKEDRVMDNFGYDPWAKNSMLADRRERRGRSAHLARRSRTRSPCCASAQYQDALANDGAFQKSYMVLPLRRARRVGPQDGERP